MQLAWKTEIPSSTSPAVATSRPVPLIIGSPTTHARIDARAGKLQIERAGHRRFRAAGIRRAVQLAVADADAHRSLKAARAPADAGADGDQQDRKARRRPVGEIVQPRRSPAEIDVFFRALWPIIEIGRIEHLVGRAGPAGREIAYQRAGATTPSEKFSARLSIAARQNAGSSSVSGSRPTIIDTALPPADEAFALQQPLRQPPRHDPTGSSAPGKSPRRRLRAGCRQGRRASGTSAAPGR